MTLDLTLNAYKKTFAEYDVHPTNQEITHQVFGDWNGPKKFGVEDINGFTEKYLKRVHDGYPHVQLYDGVKETLTTLHEKGKKMALLTTSLDTTVQPSLEQHGLSHFFEFILTANDVSNHKPDPEVIHKALEKFGGDKDHSIIIGDSKSDLGAAQNAGIDSLLFFPEHNKPFYDEEVLKSFHPTYTVSEFKELLAILNT